MLRIFVPTLYMSKNLPPKTLLDAHQYTNDEQHSIECCHHVERAPWARAVKQCASRLSEQQYAEPTKQTVRASYRALHVIVGFGLLR